MSELYGDDYDSVAGARSVPDGLRRVVGALMFLALVGALGLWAFRLGTRDAAEVPIIRAMEGPARVQPDDPGGLRAAHQGLEVNAVLAGRPAPAPDPAAPPLAPAPSALADEDAPPGELVVAAPPLAPEDALAAGDLRMPLPDEGPLPDAAAVGPGAEATGPAVAADGTISTAAMVAAAVAAAEAAAPEAPAAVAPQPAVEPATAPAGDAGPAPMRRPANLARAVGPAPAADGGAPGAFAAREVASVPRGARLVQLGAFDSEAVTRQAWNILTSRHGDLLGGKDLYVERTTSNARVFYRLRVAGFENTDQTRAMCEALRARGVDCIPVTLQ